MFQFILKHFILLFLSLFLLAPSWGENKIPQGSIEWLELETSSNPVKEVLVLSKEGNDNFIKSLASVIDEINFIEGSEIKLRILNLTYEHLLKIWDFPEEEMSPCILEPQEVSPQWEDVWMRDFCKIGRAKLRIKKGFSKGSFRKFPLIINLKRENDFNSKSLVRRLRHLWEQYSYDVEVKGGEEGGNIDVTPNGVFYSGENLSEKTIQLFKKRYSKHMAFLDTNWLDVGHVDEFVSLVADLNNKNNPCGMILLKASPLEAMSILSTVSPFKLQGLDFTYKKLWAIQKYLNDNKIYPSNLRDIYSSIDFNPSKEYKDDSPSVLNGETLFYQQLLVEQIIQNNIEILKSKIIKKTNTCKNIPIVEMPQIFDCLGTKRGVSHCVSLLPSSINFLSLGKHLVLADPHFAPFKKSMNSSLKRVELTPHYIEDTSFYHERGGGVHCATLELRESKNH